MLTMQPGNSHKKRFKLRFKLTRFKVLTVGLLTLQLLVPFYSIWKPLTPSEHTFTHATTLQESVSQQISSIDTSLEESFDDVYGKFPLELKNNLLAIARWWKSHPQAPRGLSCQRAQTDIPLWTKPNGVPSNLFKARLPQPPSHKQVQLALVVPFTAFQLRKLRALLDRWKSVEPCNPEEDVDSAQQVDLIFALIEGVNYRTTNEVVRYFQELGSLTSCFRHTQFMNMQSRRFEQQFGHLEGAATVFYRLFERLEKSYRTFMIMEPDVMPIQRRWLPPMVQQSQRLDCTSGFWQLGSVSMGNMNFGQLHRRTDFHMNGNAMYLLGCSAFEDYKCRVQTFYRPVGACARVAGCHTGKIYEDGYDHALYQFRMQPENFAYARTVLHRFAYTDFIQNYGEDAYSTKQVLAVSPATYLVHSKAVFWSKSEILLRKAFMDVLSDSPDAYKLLALSLYTGMRTGELEETDVVIALCQSHHYRDKMRDGQTDPSPFCKAAAHWRPAPWEERFPGRAYLWTADFHGGPINCDVPLIVEAGGVVHAEVDFGNCVYYGFCTQRLKVLAFDNWKGFDPSEQLKADFYDAYADDPEFQRVDAFICSHPVANCELFVEFNRSIIIHATTRLEFGRNDAGIAWRLPSYNATIAKRKWVEWINTLRKLAAEPRNIIAANSLYDVEYIRYFTGIDNVLYLPSWCGDNDGAYSSVQEGTPRSWGSSLQPLYAPTRDEILIIPYRNNLHLTRYKKRNPRKHPIYLELLEAKDNLTGRIPIPPIHFIADVHADSNPLHFVEHPAVVVIPYQVSTISIYEAYRMAVPMFVPSLTLLKRWCWEHDLMWETTYGWPSRPTDLPATEVPDPNGSPKVALNASTRAEWERRFDYWMRLADFYQWDHINYFDSWEDLFHKLASVDLVAISKAMRATNAQQRKELVSKWKQILSVVTTSRDVNDSPTATKF